MKSISLLILLVVTFGVTSLAQDKTMPFGSVHAEELLQEKYEKDPDAEAVVLYDSGLSTFPEGVNGFDVLFERRTRIKIFKPAGLKYAEFEIPFYHHGDVYEKIENLEAYTFNLENSAMVRTPLNPDDTYVEKINEYWSIRKFAMPNVKPGSVIEVRYKVRSQYKFNLRDWEFQWRIPVQFSQYVVRMIPYYSYTYLLQGARQFDEQKTFEDNQHSRRLPVASAYGDVTYSEMVHHYVMKDLPAFDDESFITNKDDYIIKLDFQLAKVYTLDGVEHSIITTWDELVKELIKHEDFGRYIKKSQKLAGKLLNLDELQGLPEKERFNKVMDYVKSNYGFNGTLGKFASKSPAQLDKEKLGSAPDLNLFAIGLLRAAGITAQPVISSTRQHGKIKTDYPFESFFNYVLIETVIDGKLLVTDATEPMLPNRRIPERCINDAGLIVKEGDISWLRLTSTVPSGKTVRLNISSKEDLSFGADITYVTSDYDAFRLRNKIGSDSRMVEEELAINGLDFDEESVQIKNLEDKNRVFTIAFKQSGKLSTIQDKIYLNPFLSQTLSENPLKQKTRSYPVDLVYPKVGMFQSRIEIPKGYTIDYIPLNKNMDNDDFALSYESFSDESSVTVYFKYYFKKSIYSPKKYDELKKYFNQIVKVGSDKLVFLPVSAEASLPTEESAE